MGPAAVAHSGAEPLLCLLRFCGALKRHALGELSAAAPGHRVQFGRPGSVVFSPAEPLLSGTSRYTHAAMRQCPKALRTSLTSHSAGHMASMKIALLAVLVLSAATTNVMAASSQCPTSGSALPITCLTGTDIVVRTLRKQGV